LIDVLVDYIEELEFPTKERRSLPGDAQTRRFLVLFRPEADIDQRLN
jgi:hypothetical protein